MINLSVEDMQIVDKIKFHLIHQVEKKGEFLEEEINDEMAVQYALGIADIFLKEQYKNPKQTNKQKLKSFLAKKITL